MFFSTEAECAAPSLATALYEGIAHTDIGLTLATVILAFVTWQLIDDRRIAKLHRQAANITHPWRRHTHTENDTDSTTSDSHTVSHTETDTTEESM